MDSSQLGFSFPQWPLSLELPPPKAISEHVSKLLFIPIVIVLLYIIPADNLRPLPIRLAISVFLLSRCMYIVLFCTTGDAEGDLGLGAAVATFGLMGSEVLFGEGGDVQRRFKCIREDGKEEEDISAASVWQRTKWGFTLFFSPRGVGWSNEPRFLKERRETLKNACKGRHRSRFVFGRVAWCIGCIGLEQGTVWLQRSNPATSTLITCAAREPDSLNPNIWDCGLWLGVVGATSFALAAFSRLQILHCALSAVSVGACGGDVENWPSLFSGPEECWTVQMFWGRAWHQMIRRPLKSVTNFVVANVFRVSRDKRQHNFISSLIWLSTAFLTTGIVHGAGELMMLRGRRSQSVIPVGSILFFQLQPLAIALERLLIYCDGKMLSPTRKAFGRLWVCVWLMWSLQFYINPIIAAGAFDTPR